MTDTANHKAAKSAALSRRHELRHQITSSLATCRCGDWSLIDETKKPLHPETVNTNYELHRRMIDR